MRARSTYVYVQLDHGPVPAGRLDMVEDGRNGYAVFQYGARYIRRPERVPVDPAALPLPDPDAGDGKFRSAAGVELFNGIRDAAPEGWGRALMHKAAEPENLGEFDYVVTSRDHRVGALAFGPDPTGGPQRVASPPAEVLGENQSPGRPFDLARLAEALARVQLVDRLDPDLRCLLAVASSLGGSRPKAAAEHRQGCRPGVGGN